MLSLKQVIVFSCLLHVGLVQLGLGVSVSVPRPASSAVDSHHQTQQPEVQEQPQEQAQDGAGAVAAQPPRQRFPGGRAGQLACLGTVGLAAACGRVFYGGQGSNNFEGVYPMKPVMPYANTPYAKAILERTTSSCAHRKDPAKWPSYLGGPGGYHLVSELGQLRQGGQGQAGGVANGVATTNSAVLVPSIARLQATKRIGDKEKGDKAYRQRCRKLRGQISDPRTPGSSLGMIFSVDARGS